MREGSENELLGQLGLAFFHLHPAGVEGQLLPLGLEPGNSGEALCAALVGPLEYLDKGVELFAATGVLVAPVAYLGELAGHLVEERDILGGSDTKFVVDVFHGADG